MPLGSQRTLPNRGQMDHLLDLFSKLNDLLFENVVQPVLFNNGWASLSEDAYTASEWFLLGILQIVIMLLVIRPLEKWRPLERDQDKKSIRVDVIYTLIQTLGVFRLFFFLLFSIPVDYVWGQLRTLGVPTFHLEQLIPELATRPLLSFLVYLVVFDFFNYWIHRAQHQWPAWWALHALHHSQRSMTYWTDSRGHLLDDVILALVGVFLSALIGLQPGQFVGLIVVSRLFESVQHANIDLRWWGVIEKLWVSPRFHRTHHAVGIGHEFSQGVLGGHNFGVLLPWWDILFGTDDFHSRVEPTGIRDQVLDGVSYGEGFWSQQWLGLGRLWVTLFGAKRVD